MKNVYEVLRQKELEASRLEKEVEASRINPTTVGGKTKEKSNGRKLSPICG